MLFKSYLRRPYTFHLERNSSDLLNVLQQEVNLTVGIIGGVQALFKELGKAFRHLIFPIRTLTDHPTGGQNQSGFFQWKTTRTIRAP